MGDELAGGNLPGGCLQERQKQREELQTRLVGKVAAALNANPGASHECTRALWVHSRLE